MYLRSEIKMDTKNHRNVILIVITHFWVIPQFTFFSLLKKYKKIKNITKKYNSEKRMPERSENGQKLVEEVQKYKD
jgi:hypothetical protein